jgi:hypothetical protein
VTRRDFAGVLAGLNLRLNTRYYALRSEPLREARLVLDAIAGPHLPMRMAVIECAQHDPGAMAEVSTYRESRFLEYRECRPQLENLRRAGIFPWLCGPGACLIPFDSLAAREKAWRTFAAGAEYGDSSVTKIEIYLSGTRVSHSTTVEESSRYRCRSQTPQQPSETRSRPSPPLP